MNEKLEPSRYEKEILTKMKKSYVPASQIKLIKRKKHKRPAEPNPLSCKKKQKRSKITEGESVRNGISIIYK